jgi:hypothetical protein
LPDASQKVLEVHETPEKVGSVPPVGLGVEGIDHEVPLKASARVDSVPDLL